MYKQMIEKLKSIFENLDKKTKKILKHGLSFCFVITIFSAIILLTYLLFLHTQLIYEIGIMVFQISLYYYIFFIASAITVDSMKKNMI